MNNISDDQILELFASEKNKEKAFGMLMRKYNMNIYQTARRIVYVHEDADDITQNVLIKIWNNLSSFRGDSSLKTWITRISVNESLTFVEKKKRMLQLDDEEYVTRILNSIPDAEQSISSEQIVELIQKGIQSLPENKEWFLLYVTMMRCLMKRCLRFRNICRSIENILSFCSKKIEEFIERH